VQQYSVVMTGSISLLPDHQHKAFLNILHSSTHTFTLSEVIFWQYHHGLSIEKTQHFSTQLNKKEFKLLCYINTWHSESNVLFVIGPIILHFTTRMYLVGGGYYLQFIWQFTQPAIRLKQMVTQWWDGYTICSVTVLELAYITLPYKWRRFYIYTLH
jgi:hypothetical protein